MRRNYYGEGDSFAYRVDEYEAPSFAGELSARAFNLLLGGTLLWGFFVNFLLCTVFGDAILGMDPIVLLISYIVLALVGILLTMRSDSAVVSFIGYNMVVVPLGLVLTFYVSAFEGVTVATAFLVTALTTLTIMLLSAAFPNTFIGFGPILGVTLVTVLIIDLVFSLIGGFVGLGMIDWIVTFLFCGYIGYDFALAQSGEKTANRAIDGACALYVDIVNLFMRILAILGKSSRDR